MSDRIQQNIFPCKCCKTAWGHMFKYGTVYVLVGKDGSMPSFGTPEQEMTMKINRGPWACPDYLRTPKVMEVHVNPPSTHAEFIKRTLWASRRDAAFQDDIRRG